MLDLGPQGSLTSYLQPDLDEVDWVCRLFRLRVPGYDSGVRILTRIC